MTPAGTFLRESPTASGDRRPRCANRSRASISVQRLARL